MHECVLYISMDGVHLILSSDGLLSDRPLGYTGNGKRRREKRWVPEPFRRWGALALVAGWLWTVWNGDQVTDTHRFLFPASEWCHACCCFPHFSSFLLLLLIPPPLPLLFLLLLTPPLLLFDIILVSTMQQHLSAREISCHHQSGLEVRGKTARDLSQSLCTVFSGSN